MIMVSLQRTLPVPDVNPSIEFETYLWKVGNFPQAELFAESNACLVRQCDAADQRVNAASLKDGKKISIQRRSDSAAAASGSEIDRGLHRKAIGSSGFPR